MSNEPPGAKAHDLSRGRTTDEVFRDHLEKRKKGLLKKISARITHPKSCSSPAREFIGDMRVCAKDTAY